MHNFAVANCQVENAESLEETARALLELQVGWLVDWIWLDRPSM